MSPAQNMLALNQANEIKYARAEIRRELKAGERTVANIIRRPPRAMRTMLVSDLLRSLPRVHTTSAAKILNRAQIGWARRLGGLTEREREALLLAIATRHPRLAARGAV